MSDDIKPDDKKPGIAIADRLGERFARARAEWEEAMIAFHEGWTRPTNPDMITGRIGGEPPAPRAKFEWVTATERSATLSRTVIFSVAFTLGVVVGVLATIYS